MWEGSLKRTKRKNTFPWNIQIAAVVSRHTWPVPRRSHTRSEGECAVGDLAGDTFKTPLAQIHGWMSVNVSLIVCMKIFLIINTRAPLAERPRANYETYYVSACTVMYISVSYSSLSLHFKSLSSRSCILHVLCRCCSFHDHWLHFLRGDTTGKNQIWS